MHLTLFYLTLFILKTYIYALGAHIKYWAVVLLGEHKLNTESGPRFPTQHKGQVWSELYTFNSSTEKKKLKTSIWFLKYLYKLKQKANKVSWKTFSEVERGIKEKKDKAQPGHRQEDLRQRRRTEQNMKRSAVGEPRQRKQWSCVPHWQVSLRVKTRW